MPDLDPVSTSNRPYNVTVNMVTGSIINFVVQFWGVRGQISAPGKETIRYGGNTSCVEIRVGNKRLILDGGSGLRVLGNNLLKLMPVEAHIFFTHCHWDSIQGFPFFIPAFVPGNCFHIYGAAAANGASMEERLSLQMQAPNFPVPIQVMQSELKFYELTSGNQLKLGDTMVEAVLLNSEQGSMGYRVTWQGHSLVYAIARSQNRDRVDGNLLHLARQADLLILDAPDSLKQDEINNSSPLNWQDEVWQTGIATAKAAGVKRLVISHYHPAYDDDFLGQIEAKLQSVFPNGLLAREGMILPVVS
ncbi:MAG TPA: MBL fold metallo-hydrolase [Cyanobacteria bacterium UBA11159]|nr:MBL fold metallo-hydrolase [Cyanobacteria bacterium UBA11367]HBE58934.1 MBL fold metallo-hydrolase [Cyanobacteria bacterium UBA11366]HBK65821.1 MBL fold metallo-hydrolase [Cyanobacteria bacterium UBA11166]HBR75896.1 MBL fold metallo-hydrolase [Cyanobacteria bacterium UBA11159]HBS68187.1 MBL fold metallo-hydrolase [Cyanobacteria bacterium UBA11153]